MEHCQKKVTRFGKAVICCVSALGLLSLRQGGRAIELDVFQIEVVMD